MNDIYEYYNILGINPTNDIEIIKKAFKKKALKYHPDKSKEINSEEKFKIVNNAYHKLLNINKTNGFIINPILTNPVIVKNIFGDNLFKNLNVGNINYNKYMNNMNKMNNMNNMNKMNKMNNMNKERKTLMKFSFAGFTGNNINKKIEITTKNINGKTIIINENIIN
jgi:curved DNA-binding protein CbpA